MLALDVSGSVDDREYRLQRDGLVAALQDAEVRAVILAEPEFPIHLAVFEWAGQFDQTLVLNWTPLSSPAALDRATATIQSAGQRPATLSTALGASMGYAASLFAQGPRCLHNTLDVSGDGKNNDWPDPRSQRAALAGVTVNALVIGADPEHTGDERQVHVAELSSYFEAEVIQGPGAFVEVALGYEEYAEAMKRKLLRELKTLVLGKK